MIFKRPLPDVEVDLYEVLEIHRGASKDEIRQAYRKAALASHPDKVPEDERPDAEIKFKSVQEAYEILYDEDKRDLYDRMGMSAFNGSGEPGMGAGPDIDDLLAQMFGGMGGGMGGMPGMGGMGGMPGGPGAVPRKSPDTVQDYEVTLEDLYKGKTVKFTSVKNVICSLCSGKGGKEKAKAKTCSTCNGEGFRQVLKQAGAFIQQSTVPCNVCNGEGSFFSPKDKCKRCKGKKTTEEKKMLEIHIAPGSRKLEKIVLKGEADQMPGRDNGDIIFRLTEAEHPVFERAGSDLHAHIDVSLVESLTGFSRVVIKHLDGRGIEITHPSGQVLSPGQVLKVSGEGMPNKRFGDHGDLYLTVNLKFPDETWKPSAATLNSLREMLPKPDGPIDAATVDHVTFDAKADIEQFGAQDANGGSAWMDDDDEDDEPASCAAQ
ncbi:hypothetical protein N7492_006287 [Penicillium capsulatum]|uniref:Uncharacterized protein n=1 Tax=Penicillium capsulatum TaxID=69766 RepID=A0A9W9I2L8_9EURO|nr:hypothetical protein N7492_006287 [Penicillium capsulatum]KAJ6108938.1 hypothetical protein N7512_008775 [Penicillium capsulatum]